MTIQETNIFLPIDYKPTDNDILSGRGRTLNNHNGNKHFIDIIKSNLQQYIDAPRRMHKSFVIDEIVAHMFASGYRFIRKHSRKTNQWCVLYQDESYKRVGHALRDMKYSAMKKQRQKDINNNTLNSYENLPKLTRSASGSNASCSSDEDMDGISITSSSDSEFDIETICNTFNIT
jgi:hypothetical protein